MSNLRLSAVATTLICACASAQDNPFAPSTSAATTTGVGETTAASPSSTASSEGGDAVPGDDGSSAGAGSDGADGADSTTGAVAPPCTGDGSTPEITAVVGDGSHGSTLTIQGCGFGTKDNPVQPVPAAPLMWDTTDAQLLGGVDVGAYAGLGDGDPVPGTVWTLVEGGDNEVRYTTSRDHRHPHQTSHYASYDGNSYAKLALGYLEHIGGGGAPATQKRYYLSFYRKVANPACSAAECPDGGGDGSCKLLRVDNRELDFVGSTIVAHLGVGTIEHTGWVFAGDETTWVRWEMYVDTERGWLDAWKNGSYHLGSWSGAGGTVELRPAADWRFRSPGLEGFEFDTPTLPPEHAIEAALFGYDDSHSLSTGQQIDLGEIYYDDTPARIELSDQPTWDDTPGVAQHREVQGRLTSWSDDRIELELEHGGFASGEQVYVYVMNGDLRVNGAGFPLALQ